MLYQKSMQHSLLGKVEHLVSEMHHGHGGSSSDQTIKDAELKLFKQSMRGARDRVREAKSASEQFAKSGKLLAEDGTLV